MNLLRSCLLTVFAAGLLPISGAIPFDQPPTVIVDGKTIVFKNAPAQVVLGRTMVPLRGVFEAIGAYVDYDEENRVITAKRDNEMLELRLGDKIAKKNGAEIMLDAPPKVIDGTTMVPLRFISESLGAKVEYDKANNRILISTPS